MTDLRNCTQFMAASLPGIKHEIDVFLQQEKPFKDVPLILTASGSRRITYRGISIREWHDDGRVRYDSAVELL